MLKARERTLILFFLVFDLMLLNLSLSIVAHLHYADFWGSHLFFYLLNICWFITYIVFINEKMFQIENTFSRVKNIVIKSESVGTNQSPISGPVNLNVAPGAVGTPSAPNVTPCRAPRGFSKVGVFFKGTPEFNGCFFMADNMKSQMYREIGHEDTEAQITFRGDSRTGYMISFYRLGN